MLKVFLAPKFVFQELGTACGQEMFVLKPVAILETAKLACEGILKQTSVLKKTALDVN